VDEASKRRLVGAAVLALAAAMVLPRVINLPPPVDEIPHQDLPTVPASNNQGRVRPLVGPEESQVRPLVPLSGTGQAANMLPLPDPVAEPTTPGDDLPHAGIPFEPLTPPVAEPTGPPSGASGWVVQVGSFSSKENADRLVEELRGRGARGFAEPFEVQGKKIFRVLVGPEADKPGAERVRQSLDPWIKERKLSGQIRSYP
jgi:DedD protein